MFVLLQLCNLKSGHGLRNPVNKVGGLGIGRISRSSGRREQEVNVVAGAVGGESRR